MAGPTLQEQPLQIGSRYLQWNGEVFGGLSFSGNDTVFLAKECAVNNDFHQLFSKIEGPFSFTLCDTTLGNLWYGRDLFGRRSLLVHHPTVAAPFFCLSSCSGSGVSWKEVPSNTFNQFSFETFQIISRPLRLLRPEPLLGLSSTEALLTTHRLLQASVHRCIRFSCQNQSVGVLFSGGVDSMVLSLLVARCVSPSRPIVLINVSIETTAASFETPDRQNALLGFAELEKITRRPFHFYPVNIPRKEALATRGHVIKLIQPANTEMDVSIAHPLWLAARGISWQNDEKQELALPSVLLSGSGADELFGGYAHHRATFLRKGEMYLQEQLFSEVAQMGERNLGRDCRCLADWNREIYHPFLEEDLSFFLLSLPVSQRCDLKQTPGKGDKMLLRNLANHLGLSECAQRLKKAIQFGSGSGKLFKDKRKGQNLLDG